MASISRGAKAAGGTAFQDNTTAYGSEVETDFDTIYTAWNAHNSGSSTWSVVNATTGTIATLGSTTATLTTANITTANITTAAITTLTVGGSALFASFAVKKPNLVYVSATSVDVEANTATTNETSIVFPDGNIRSVTEDTSSTHKYRRFIITAAAEFTSGTEDSGLRSGIAEAANTWYAIYAVKSVIDTTKFVLAGDTTVPIQSNVATLNSRYGTNGWVYLGTIRNGADGASSTSDILSFVQHGNRTDLRNADNAGSTGALSRGIRFGSNSAVTVSWTYAAGTGNAQVPNNILIGSFSVAAAATANVKIVDDAGTGAQIFYRGDATNAVWLLEFKDMYLTNGIRVTNGGATSIAYNINFVGWVDGALNGNTGLI
jgi:hypothetical protein